MVWNVSTAKPCSFLAPAINIVPLLINVKDRIFSMQKD